MELYEALVHGGPALQALAIAWCAWEIKMMRQEFGADIEDVRVRLKRLEDREEPAR